jgi:hypothetical protein
VYAVKINRFEAIYVRNVAMAALKMHRSELLALILRESKVKVAICLQFLKKEMMSLSFR